MIPSPLQNLKIILASASPRRKYLLDQMGLNFDVISREVKEDFPPSLSPTEVAGFLAEKKSGAFSSDEISGKTLITADTIVVQNEKIIGKPADREDAVKILKMLSGNEHIVITAVCIVQGSQKIVFSVESQVLFRELADPEINFYIDQYKPFDKAGAYGVQDWIGLTAIKKINGSYFNVMGLPTCELYLHLKELK